MASKGLLFTILFTVIFVLFDSSDEVNAAKKQKAKIIGKDVKDFTDVDVHHLLDQWNENDEDYEPDENDDPRIKKGPNIPFDPKVMASDPQAMLKLTKKGKPLMMFVTVAGNPTQKETETISGLWQQGLHNAQFQLTRYVIAQNRVLLHIEDGSKAYDIKDFLITQKQCAKVEFDNQEFVGAGAIGEKSKSEL